MTTDGHGRPRVVIASMDARTGQTFDDLEQLVRFLATRPIDLEVVLVGDGERLRDLRTQSKVTVVDAFRRRGPGRVAGWVGGPHLARRVKSLRLRRWVDRRDHATWIVHHPTATSILRYAAAPPSKLVVSVHVPTAFDHARAIDAETLAGADLWLATTPEHRDDLSVLTTAPVLAVGDLTDHADLPDLPPEGDGEEPILLLPPSGAWHGISHTVEVASRLAVACPDLSLAWAARNAEDRWMAEHDVSRLGLGARLRVVSPTEWTALRPRLVVRTGYSPAESGTALAAALAGVPVIGFDLTDLLGPGAEAHRPFDVEGLVAQAICLLTQPNEARALGRRQGETARTRGDLARRLDPLVELIEGG